MKSFVIFSSSVVQLPTDRISDMTVAILLAAGAGSRFGGVGHKLDATIGGRSVAEIAIAAALDSGIGPVLVVTGAHRITFPAGAVEVENPDWADGQITSLRRGIDAARDLGATAVVVGLADQPFVTAEAWRAVAASTSPIAVATYGGRRGNPVRLDHSVWHLLPESGDEGARGLIRVRPDLVEPIPCAGSPADIDTEEDLRRWQSNSSTNSP
jgi:CTP:molybdopterin cytidylyltransferase MocA